LAHTFLEVVDAQYRTIRHVLSALVRTQKFSEKAKAPPTLIENRELGLFFIEGQLLCDQRSNGGFAGHQLLDIATQRKPTQIFSTIFIASR
jgi:hypothetical protein